MSTDIQHSKRIKEGGTAIVLLLITFVLSATLASYLKFSLNTARTTRRAISYQKARILAESAMDAAESQLHAAVEMAEIGMFYGSLQSYLDDQSKTIKQTIDATTGSAYELDVITMEPQSIKFIPTVIDKKKYECMDVVITAGITNRKDGVTAACQETVRITRESFLNYAYFFDGRLEMSPDTVMFVDGDIRSNSDIELGASRTLQFEGTIQCRSGLKIRPRGWRNGTPAKSSQRIKLKTGNGSYEPFYQNNAVLDTGNPNWAALSRDVWEGRVQAGAHVAELKPPIGTETNIQLIKPREEDDSPTLKHEKMAYKADLHITVRENGSVAVTTPTETETIPSSQFAAPVGNSGANGVYKVNGKGWINVHAGFYDRRESELAYEEGYRLTDDRQKQEMQMADIYIDKLLEQYPGTRIVYIEIEKPANESHKPAVRIRNGASLKGASAEGLSIATHRMLYMEGNFNNEGKVPAMIACDCITLLSNNWNDKNSGKAGNGGRQPRGASTHLNAAVLAGYANPVENDYSNAALRNGRWSGHVQNFVRFRENLGNRGFYFNGSIISLWHAEDSHCLHVPCFRPPGRYITYDPSLQATPPPGMPMAYWDPEVVFWEETDWESALEAKQALEDRSN